VSTQATLQRLGKIGVEKACVTRGRCPWAPHLVTVLGSTRLMVPAEMRMLLCFLPMYVLNWQLQAMLPASLNMRLTLHVACNTDATISELRDNTA
jgi:hypothetical protein